MPTERHRITLEKRIKRVMMKKAHGFSRMNTDKKPKHLPTERQRIIRKKKIKDIYRENSSRATNEKHKIRQCSNSIRDFIRFLIK